MAELFAMAYRDLSLYPPDPVVLSQIPEGFCRRRGVFPVAFEDGALHRSALPTPRLQTLDDLRAVVLAERCRRLVVAPGQLRRAIEIGYQAVPLAAEDDPSTASQADPPRPPMSQMRIVPDTLSLSQAEAPVVRLVNGLFRRAVDERASDIHIEAHKGWPTASGSAWDGMLYDVTDTPVYLRFGRHQPSEDHDGNGHL